MPFWPWNSSLSCTVGKGGFCFAEQGYRQGREEILPGWAGLSSLFDTWVRVGDGDGMAGAAGGQPWAARTTATSGSYSASPGSTPMTSATMSAGSASRSS